MGFRVVYLHHTKALEDLACANPDFRELYENDSMQNELSLVVENYVLAGLHSKLFSTLGNLYKEEDDMLLERMSSWVRNGVNPVDFGLRVELAPFANVAISHLQRIESSVTPIEKLWCVSFCEDLWWEISLIGKGKRRCQQRNCCRVFSIIFVTHEYFSY